MKKLYILIFSLLFILGFSQPYSILLSNVNWKIVKIQWNNVDYYPPPPLSIPTANFLNGNNLTTHFFDSGNAFIIFGSDNQNYFNVPQGMGTTLADYGGENQQAVQHFDEMNTGFYNAWYGGFQQSGNFYFEYQEVMSGKNLVVTNPAGNKIFYSNLLLDTNEISKQKISIYPNPATDIIFIDNLKPNSSLELIDNSGKLVKSISNNKTSKTEINIKNLNSGIYYLKVDGQSVQKIIKK
jgi:hypothetical protein